jgi:membrane-associated phospholipid phosphatase
MPGSIRIRARRLVALVAALWLLCPIRGARAQVRELRYDAAADVGLTVTGGTLYLASVLLHPATAPTQCRWCAANALDERTRDSLMWSQPMEAADLSDVSLALVPLTGIGLDAVAATHDHASRGVGVDVLIIAEATVLALDANEITKLIAARERPVVRAARLRDVTPAPRMTEDFLSFYSGHTTGAFALAAATGTVATMRGYRWAPAPWIAGGALAVGTGYFRIAADRHWLTDVLVGMLTGVAIGIVVPLALHSPSSG